MKIVLDEGAIMPTRAHENDAGLDLYSREEKVVPAGGSACFDTGVHIQLPLTTFQRQKGASFFSIPICKTVGFLKSKSGLNVKHGITSEGVIDMGYTGSIVVKLYNHGDEDYHVHAGDKISQLVVLPVITPDLELVNKLEDADRGDNGFGSTGR